MKFANYGIARLHQDAAGGLLLGNRQDFVFVEGTLWAVYLDPVTPHGPPPHSSPVMAEGSSFIFINDIPVCREGHLASCGHATTGSSNMYIDD